MSHPAQMEYVTKVKAKFPDYFGQRRVLEVGSLNINGTVRDFFTDCDYVGVDLEHGLGVDMVEQGQELDFEDRDFDVSISAECFEHNPFWLETFLNMRRMTAGLVIVTCATVGRAEHGTHGHEPSSSPFTVDRWDYYQNLTEQDFHDAIDLDELFVAYEFTTNDFTHDLYFWGLVSEENL